MSPASAEEQASTKILPLTLALRLFFFFFFGVTEGIQLWCIFIFVFFFQLFLGYWHSSVQVSSVFWEASSTPRWRLAGQLQTSVPLHFQKGIQQLLAGKTCFNSFFAVIAWTESQGRPHK